MPEKNDLASEAATRGGPVTGLPGRSVTVTISPLVCCYRARLLAGEVHAQFGLGVVNQLGRLLAHVR